MTYLFLIPLTPPELLDPKRKVLQDLCFNQLRKIKADYKVWLLGDYPESSGDFDTVQVQGKSKEDKLYEVCKILAAAYTPVARYIIRLDDDDLINPAVFDAMATEKFDCCTDRCHWFYDLSSGLTGKQKRAWFPNTVIHSYGHALQKIEAVGGAERAGNRNYLLACDHSQAWHEYYQGKKVRKAPGDKPLYLRVLTPGSITAKNHKRDQNENYQNYLATFGDWKANFPLDGKLKGKLRGLWQKEEGELNNFQFKKKHLLSRLADMIKS